MSLRRGERKDVPLLTPHSADDWPKIIANARRKPPSVSSRPSEAELKALADFALSGGPFVTDDVNRVGEVIRRVQRANTLAAAGGRRVVVVNGRFHHGKTHAALVPALQQVEAAQDEKSPHAVIPWVYVELSASGEGRSVVESVLRFIGAPVPARGTMPSLTRVLRLLAPEIRLQGVIIDDLGSAARANGGHERPGAIATALKSLVMQLPATVVLIGTDLNDAPMFSQVKPVAPAQQILRRATWVELGPWGRPSVKPGQWHRLVATLSKHLAFPRQDQFAIKNAVGVATLHEVAEGRPGSAIEIVQHAAAAAIENGWKLDPALLGRIADEIRGDRA